MNSKEIRQKFLDFFEKRGHSVIPSASLVPENDPSVLFNTAGMQPLVPYLLGEEHPAGKRIVDVQKCVRTTDIEEVGDKTHLTFFEMLGNWSLGDYFKEDAIKWSYEFLTNKEEGLGLNPKKLYVTVFEGNGDASRDEKSYGIWREIFEKAGLSPDGHIFFMSAKSNWWPQPKEKDEYSGPCGPDSEMFYDVTENDLGDLTREEFIKADDEQRVVEVWNDVFMEYEKKEGKVIGKLAQKNVDTGAGLERLAVMMQKVDNVYETDLFIPLMSKIKEITPDYEIANSEVKTRSKENILKSTRIIADHVRTAVFMISDGVVPANTDRGYILRRIIRRAVRHMRFLRLEQGSLFDLTNIVINQYSEIYKNIEENKELIRNEIQKEEGKFMKTLENGLKQIDKLFLKYGGNMKEFELNANVLFDLYQTHGFPIEISLEEINRRRVESGGVVLDNVVERHFINLFEEEMKKHQELSRTASTGKFKGGLGGHDEDSTKLHTATHLLHQALREVLGEYVEQKGSNITSERLRFDFSHSGKMTDEEKQKVEEIINQKIQEGLEVKVEEMSPEEAKRQGALGVFSDKYGDRVKVYSIDNFSKEICGGPHVENTKELGEFKIKKESASSAGVRRIKAILE